MKPDQDALISRRALRLCRNALFLVALFTTGTAYSEDNLSFKGTLVAEPCVIAAADENATVDLGNIVDKYLYINQTSPKVTFTLKLSDCDIALAGQATVTFSGTESQSLPGYLSPDVIGTARGIAIGIEQANGTLMALNQAGSGFRLAPGENSMVFRAFVRGEPASVAQRSIVKGDFSGTATFSFTYE